MSGAWVTVGCLAAACVLAVWIGVAAADYNLWLTYDKPAHTILTRRARLRAAGCAFLSVADDALFWLWQKMRR